MNNSDFYNTIFMRKSIRKYRKELLESSKLMDLQKFMERLAPSSSNTQPWYFSGSTESSIE